MPIGLPENKDDIRPEVKEEKYYHQGHFVSSIHLADKQFMKKIIIKLMKLIELS